MKYIAQRPLDGKENKPKVLKCGQCEERSAALVSITFCGQFIICQHHTHSHSHIHVYIYTHTHFSLLLKVYTVKPILILVSSYFNKKKLNCAIVYLFSVILHVQCSCFQLFFCFIYFPFSLFFLFILFFLNK